MSRTLNGNLTGKAAHATQDDAFSVKLNKLERLSVALDVARSLQKQIGWDSIIAKGEAMENNTFLELVDLCLTDPRHIDIHGDDSELGTHFTIEGGEVIEFGSPQWFDNIQEIPL